LEFNVPFQHKYGYIRDEGSNCTRVCHSDVLYMISKMIPLLLQ